jgi:hypothetical protein
MANPRPQGKEVGTMNKYLLSFAVILLLAGTARADFITDVIVFEFGSTDSYYGTDPDGRIQRLSSDPGVVAWLNTPVGSLEPDMIVYAHFFAPPDGTITSAVLTLTLRENDANPEYAYAVHGDLVFWDLGEVDTGTHTYSTSVDPEFFAAFPGLYNVGLASALGDFAIDRSELKVEYEPTQVQPIPEFSTIALLGMVLVASAGLGLRRSRRA